MLAGLKGRFVVKTERNGKVLKGNNMLDNSRCFVEWYNDDGSRAGSDVINFLRPASLALEMQVLNTGTIDTVYKHIEGGLAYIVGEPYLFWSMMIHRKATGMCFPPCAKDGGTWQNTWCFEELVRLMLKEDLDGKEILDIGTGTGCIAISLAKNLPNAKVSGGVSNVSFSFRGNNIIREAMHSAFLFHAIKNGLDMGIVNAGMIEVYEEIPKNILKAVEDVLLNRDSNATERLLSVAEKVSGKINERKEDLEWRKRNTDERLSYSLVKGVLSYLEEDVEEARKKFKKTN